MFSPSLSLSSKKRKQERFARRQIYNDGMSTVVIQSPDTPKAKPLMKPKRLSALLPQDKENKSPNVKNSLLQKSTSVLKLGLGKKSNVDKDEKNRLARRADRRDRAEVIFDGMSTVVMQSPDTPLEKVEIAKKIARQRDDAINNSNKIINKNVKEATPTKRMSQTSTKSNLKFEMQLEGLTRDKSGTPSGFTEVKLDSPAPLPPAPAPAPAPAPVPVPVVNVKSLVDIINKKETKKPTKIMPASIQQLTNEEECSEDMQSFSMLSSLNESTESTTAKTSENEVLSEVGQVSPMERGNSLSPPPPNSPTRGTAGDDNLQVEEAKLRSIELAISMEKIRSLEVEIQPTMIAAQERRKEKEKEAVTPAELKKAIDKYIAASAPKQPSVQKKERKVDKKGKGASTGTILIRMLSLAITTVLLISSFSLFYTNEKPKNVQNQGPGRTSLTRTKFLFDSNLDKGTNGVNAGEFQFKRDVMNSNNNKKEEEKEEKGKEKEKERQPVVDNKWMDFKAQTHSQMVQSRTQDIKKGWLTKAKEIKQRMKMETTKVAFQNSNSDGSGRGRGRGRGGGMKMLKKGVRWGVQAGVVSVLSTAVAPYVPLPAVFLRWNGKISAWVWGQMSVRFRINYCWKALVGVFK